MELNQTFWGLKSSMETIHGYINASDGYWIRNRMITLRDSFGRFCDQHLSLVKSVVVLCMHNVLYDIYHILSYNI